MKVAGIDVSTFNVDIVTIDIDQRTVEWTRHPLVGADAFERTRTVAAVLPGRTSVWWDDVLAVGIEEPAGRNPGFAFRVQGAVLACIPARMLVEKWMPSQWRKRVGLKGNAPKADVYQWVAAQHTPSWTARGHDGRASNATLLLWPQDAADAYCVALATRQALEQVAA